MNEWLNSDEGVETAIRLSNHIVKKYQGHSWFTSRSGERLLQPEILSITYLSMDKVLSKFDPTRGTVKTFLWKAVPREVFRQVKKELYDYQEYEDWMQEYNEPIDTYELIESLPPQRRERFKMHLEGYTYKEIKEEHNISTSMVYKDIELAREHLRKELDL